MNSFYQFQFYLFSLIAVVSALFFVTRRSPVPAALWLVNVMFALSGLYVMLDAPFVGVIQVLVYAGAIMVVFVFVVMLLNLGRASEIKAPNAKTFLRADALNNGSRLGSAILKPFREGIVLTGAWWNALASRRRVLARCTLHAGIQAGGDSCVF